MTFLTATISNNYRPRLLGEFGRLQPLAGYVRVAGEHRQDSWSVPIGDSIPITVPEGAQIFECEVAIDDSAAARWGEFRVLGENGELLCKVGHKRGHVATRIQCPLFGNTHVRLASRARGVGEALWFSPLFGYNYAILSPCAGHRLTPSSQKPTGKRALIVYGGMESPEQDTLSYTHCDTLFWLTDSTIAETTVPIIRAEKISDALFAPGLEWAAFTAASFLLPLSYEEVIVVSHADRRREAIRTAAHVLNSSRKPHSGLISPALIEPPVVPLSLRETMRWRYAASEEDMASLLITPAAAAATDLHSYRFWAGARADAMRMDDMIRQLVPRFCNWSVADTSFGRAGAILNIASCLLREAEESQ